MSRITRPKGETPEEFGMRIVSGMYDNGAIKVTWATGEESTSQIDWGLSRDLDYVTIETDTGTNMLKYHSVPYPNVYVDTEHFFRARSRNKEGTIKESDIYSILVPTTQTITNEGLYVSPKGNFNSNDLEILDTTIIIDIDVELLATKGEEGTSTISYQDMTSSEIKNIENIEIPTINTDVSHEYAMEIE